MLPSKLKGKTNIFFGAKGKMHNAECKANLLAFGQRSTITGQRNPVNCHLPSVNSKSLYIEQVLLLKERLFKQVAQLHYFGFGAAFRNFGGQVTALQANKPRF